AIHGDKSQIDRIKALDAFKAGETHALIATDVAARGLDVDDLPYVINYELPHTPEDYVHRIGRTGRAGKMGNAISLVSAHEVGYLVDIEKLIKRPIEQVEVAGFEPEPEYEYPPGNKRKRSSAPPPKAPLANKPERHERGDRRPPRRNPMIAADGFDFSKPYEESTPRGEIPDSPKAPPKADPHKPKRVVAALLGGLGRK
ncbi:MAG: ATP-dependent helicase, partial [Dechloromonas sp.]|nr:ATP-dependent helicase [Dechloromonas sp.]